MSCEGKVGPGSVKEEDKGDRPGWSEGGCDVGGTETGEERKR